MNLPNLDCVSVFTHAGLCLFLLHPRGDGVFGWSVRTKSNSRNHQPQGVLPLAQQYHGTCRAVPLSQRYKLWSIPPLVLVGWLVGWNFTHCGVNFSRRSGLVVEQISCCTGSGRKVVRIMHGGETCGRGFWALSGVSCVSSESVARCGI